MSVTFNVNLKYFASIREAIGQGSERVATQAVTLQALRDELIACLLYTSPSPRDCS